MEISNNDMKPKKLRKKIILPPTPSLESVTSLDPPKEKKKIKKIILPPTPSLDPPKKQRKKIILKIKPISMKIEDTKKKKTYYLERPIKINNICFTDEELKQKIKVLCVMQEANEVSDPIFHYP